MNERAETLQRWVARQHDLPLGDCRLEQVAGDASFRHYYRLHLPDGTPRVLMDAPPERENSRAFVDIARDWRAVALPVPALHAVDLAAGFVELEDLGDDVMHQHLTTEAAADTWFTRALDLLEHVQRQAPSAALPAYDRDLLGRELDLFPDWCLSRLLEIPAPPEWPALREALIDSALAQPRVAVHRDFDAMNLMVRDDTLWLIDFQDAVRGPISYDLVSLLRGRYRLWSRERMDTFIETFHRRAVADGRLPADSDIATFTRQVEAMGIQRSLKVLGIFCRLALRDAKPRYLARLPHFLAHLHHGLEAVPEHAAFLAWVETTLTPALQRALEHHGIARTREESAS
ncbi:aminoglycoside phosphotransferase family protein [Chromohalobacter israelensis]|uniref:aminoglycoside phosphotransferase family protein n=1 Tax=Chromohalobacter israelensis TaxID=141390 RepID=UPI001CC5D1D5|nr:phosphotransferase [Chromohalobacter salexigens]MBZ5875662.1 phosphotransferase [Chromohalobacter salexigens]